MGGWRCSYRNCTIRSDGKTHMFHYPVFDKVRCHQWLVNAGRLDFLNLKVSQLKNRVVCQHHFADDQFMNFKRDKLTFDAVPTMNGPFCDISEGESKSHEETTKSLSIIFDDIENEYMTLNDKKANYSVKYADFLTSNELADIDISTYVPQHNVFNRNKYSEIEHNSNPDLFDGKDDKTSLNLFKQYSKPSLTVDTQINSSKMSTPEIHKKYQTPPVLVVPPYKAKSNPSQSQPEENYLEIELPPGFLNNNNLLTDNIGNNHVSISGNIDNQPAIPTSTPMKKPAVVRVLSEKKISSPLKVTGNLEPLSPSTILPKLLKKPPKVVPPQAPEEISLNNQEFTDLTLIQEPVIKEVEDKTLKLNKEVKEQKLRQKLNKEIEEQKLRQNNKVSLLKNKITPERIAAIEKKRKFNMKLRDIIENFLDKLDEQDKEIKDSSNGQNQDNTNKSCFPKQSKVLNAKDHTIASLEARIKKMEDNLLRKIDLNSQKIVELKKTIEKSQESKKPPMASKKSLSTQTSLDDECEKKLLYKQISQYLSPDANSLIYEELFINKYAQDVSKTPSAKRKRRR